MQFEQRVIRGFWFHVFDVLYNVVVIVVIVGVVRTFIVAPFQVEGNSMVDTLLDNQYIIIDKFTYRFLHDPERGDVVVFRPPTDVKRYYVKRIIGLPGDEVVIRDGRVFLTQEGQLAEIPEEYLNARNRNRTFRPPVAGGDPTEERYRVNEEAYFVLGDNRQGSFDSRSFHAEEGTPTTFIPRQNISGRVWIVALPIKKIHALETPEYDLD